MMWGSDFRLTGRRLAVEVALTPWVLLAWISTLEPFSIGNHRIEPRYAMFSHFFVALAVTTAISILLGLIFGRNALERLALVGTSLVIALLVLVLFPVL